MPLVLTRFSNPQIRILLNLGTYGPVNKVINEQKNLVKVMGDELIEYYLCTLFLFFELCGLKILYFKLYCMDHSSKN